MSLVPGPAPGVASGSVPTARPVTTDNHVPRRPARPAALAMPVSRHTAWAFWRAMRRRTPPWAAARQSRGPLPGRGCLSCSLRGPFLPAAPYGAAFFRVPCRGLRRGLARGTRPCPAHARLAPGTRRRGRTRSRGRRRATPGQHLAHSAGRGTLHTGERAGTPAARRAGLDMAKYRLFPPSRGSVSPRNSRSSPSGASSTRGPTLRRAIGRGAACVFRAFARGAHGVDVGCFGSTHDTHGHGRRRIGCRGADARRHCDRTRKQRSKQTCASPTRHGSYQGCAPPGKRSGMTSWPSLV